ncbi:MAG: hypothetical protein OER56_08395 [Hyphomicrobiales bacterium]|nr:hypothetical protein [Hyphomicrobiales bacterium]
MGILILAAAAALISYSLATIAEARGNTKQNIKKTWIVGAVPSLASFVASITAPSLQIETEPRAN